MPTDAIKVGEATDESSLVKAAKAGNIEAFEQLIRRYDRNVFRIAQHITQNREDAEDVVQDAFLKAYTNLPGFQEQSRFYTWLVRIAVNEALMKLRRRRTGKIVSREASAPERGGHDQSHSGERHGCEQAIPSSSDNPCPRAGFQLGRG